MKRLILAILGLMLSASLAYSAGSCPSPSLVKGHLSGPQTSNFTLSGSCVADAADGSFPGIDVGNIGGYLMSVTVIPGLVTVPTTGLDMYIYRGTVAEPTTADLLGTFGVDMDTSGQVDITPNVGTVDVPKGFTGPVFISFSGNSVNSATLDYYIELDSGN